MKAIIQHLRFPFSLLLLPVFLFALSENNFSNTFELWPAVLLFFILHILVYPSSNAYNSLQDKDEGSIGLIEKPLQVPQSLNFITIFLDVVAVLLCLFFKNWQVVAPLVFLYILFSRLYSYRKIRIKQFAILGFITVFIFQGFIIFLITDLVIGFNMHLELALASSCLIGSMYPLSQIYQHQQDAADGVNTLSMRLGYVGTFIFSAVLFAIGASVILAIYLSAHRMAALYTFIICTFTVLLFFMYWFNKVRLQTTEANFKNTMLMNIVSCVCLNLCFIIILIFKL